MTVIQRLGEAGTVHDAYIWESNPADNHNWSELYTGRYGWGCKKTLLHFDLTEIPLGTTIHNARLVIDQLHPSGDRTVYVHRITQAWTESEVTWSNFGDSYDPVATGSFDASAEGKKSVDITLLVQTWVDGTSANYGVLLHDPSAGEDEYETYHSSEHHVVALRPRLEVCWSR